MPVTKNMQRFLTEENLWPDTETGEIPPPPETPPEEPPPAQ